MNESQRNIQAERLKDRTKQFAVNLVRFLRQLPKTDEARTMGRQLLRSGTAIAANYRSVCRARSKAEFIARVGVVVEEADESVFWLEMMAETEVAPEVKVAPLLSEANELLAIFAASQRTAKVSNG